MTRKQASFFALSWLFVFGGSDLALLAACLAVQLFSLLSLGELSLPIPRTNLTGMSGHGVGNQCRGPRHQLLLQCWNVLRSAELLLALCPGSLVLSLHSCFSLTNSLLVPPLGISGPFLRQLWPTVVQYSNLQSRDFKRFHLYFLKKKMALLNCFEIQCTTILWQVKSNNKKASMPCF